MEQWTDIRRRVLVERVSRRTILKETGMHWTTLQKILGHSEPPGYRQQAPRPKKKLGPYMDRIAGILEADRSMPPKQRHTAKRIWQVLQEEGFTGGYTAVKDAVRDLTRKNQEVFVPLVHRPGEAQTDFGHALVRMNGVLRKVPFFVMALPYSDAFFVMAFERECTETFWEGHVQAFSFFGGVANRITYDNTSIAVSAILGKDRRLTSGFLQLKSHYLFEHRFCRVARGNEKGVVEGLVKFTRLNFFVPVPQVRDFAELNEHLRACCTADQARRLRGKPGTKAALLKEDQAAFLPLPATPFDACRKVNTFASSLSLVRFDTNDYSVPVSWAHQALMIKGYCDAVAVYAAGVEVARHPRLWTREQVHFDPVHYLALLERKPGALDVARPLADWNLPRCFDLLRRRMEAEHGSSGIREYIQTLRLLEKHSLSALGRAVEKALAIGANTRDAVAQFLYPEEDLRAGLFRLDGHPHLRSVRVEGVDVRAYGELLGARA